MCSPWYFVLPEERSKPSGGNIYNERIVSVLRQVGRPVETISTGDYLRAVRQDQSGFYWVDTLLLNDIREVLSLKPNRACSLLIVHHLESLAPLSGQAVEELRAQEQPWLTWFQGFLATSHFTESYLRQRKVTQPVVVVEPGTDTTTMEIPERNLKKIRALTVANLVDRKGVLPGLQWLARNTKEGNQFSWTIVGRLDIEPAYAQHCISIIDEHPLLQKCVRLVGSQPPDQMTDFYRESNLFVSLASMETFGMALQEARTYQLPILTMKGGYSSHHITSGQTGYVFSDLPQLGSFFLELVQEPSKFAILYQRTQQHPASYLSWTQTARELIQQFNLLFSYAP